MGENEKDYEKEAARKRELERERERESRERVERRKKELMLVIIFSAQNRTLYKDDRKWNLLFSQLCPFFLVSPSLPVHLVLLKKSHKEGKRKICEKEFTSKMFNPIKRTSVRVCHIPSGYFFITRFSLPLFLSPSSFFLFEGERHE